MENKEENDCWSNDEVAEEDLNTEEEESDLGSDEAAADVSDELDDSHFKQEKNDTDSTKSDTVISNLGRQELCTDQLQGDRALGGSITQSTVLGDAADEADPDDPFLACLVTDVQLPYEKQEIKELARR